MKLITLVTTILLIGTSNGIEVENDKSIDQNITLLPRKGGFRFEDDINPDYPSQNDNSEITFEEQSAHFKFDESPDQLQSTRPIKFQDDNRIEDAGIKKKRRRRRRKPKYQGLGPYPGAQGQFPGFPDQPLPGQPLPGQFSGQYPAAQGFFPGQQIPGFPLPGQGQYPVAPGQAYPDDGQSLGPGGVPPAGQYYKPPRRPKQSLAFEALTRVTEALTSIALYDDYQCVPRLLCEAAGGGALGASNALQSVVGLQPLLTLLSAYSGISASPLFVFGRAVLLGMTSKGNPASCRYAYPQCPTDPEQLVHYLNNHNGGFFRFFNAPQQQIPQNLEQFYNQLTNFGQHNQQNYGFYEPQNPQINQNGPQYNPQINQNVPHPQQYGLNDPQNINGQYGFYNPQYGLYDQLNSSPGQQFGPNPQAYAQQPGYHLPNDQQNYGLYNPQYYQIPQPNPSGLYHQYPGPQNPYANKYGYGNHKNRKPSKDKYGFANVNFKDSGAEGNRIQKRIQNKPSYDEYIIDNENNSGVSNYKWTFPDNKKNKVGNDNVRGGKNLKFPEGYISSDNNKKSKSITFPGSQNYKYYDYPQNNEGFIIRPNIQNYNVDNAASSYSFHTSNMYNVGSGTYGIDDDDEIQTVYIVRDDPNNPEIVKVRKGQKVG